MFDSTAHPNALGAPISSVQVAPAIAYYIRKLLRQNLDRLTADPLHFGMKGDIRIDPLSDLNEVLTVLYPDEAGRRTVVQQMERAALLHQSLSGQEINHRQDLEKTEQQLFAYLGFTFGNLQYCGSVVIVDDTPANVDLLTMALTRHSYRLWTAVNGVSAINLVKTVQPDLIVLDIMLPEIDGYQVCAQIKADPLTCDIPVIFMSALDDTQVKIKAFELGGVDYITKPFQIKEVVARIDHQVKLHQLQKRLAEQNVRLQQQIKERQQAEEWYRNIVENSLDGIFQAAPNGRYIRANAALAQIYGYESVDELLETVTNIGQQLYVQPGRQEELSAYLQQHGQVAGVESLVYRKDGSTMWISETARRVTDDQGHLLYYEGTVRDISDRRQAELELRHQRKKTDRLLMRMLPRSVAERLKRKRKAIADPFDQVTVLFADIYQFTALSSGIPVQEQVDILNHLFSAFDNLVTQNGLEKIKTMRDRYMVAGGVPDAKADHAEAIADMALAMQQITLQFQAEINHSFQLRIGISTGTVIAGVIGTQKLTYDLWGDTVNVASRMQTLCLPGHIQVAPSTYECLQQTYAFEPRGAIEVPGIGDMTTYWLQGKRPKA